jgi:hypothetical protein
MKKLLFIFFIASGLFVSCVENPEENPTPLPPPGNVTATFDNQNFQSVTTVTVIDAVSMSLKATDVDGSYFKITLPENPLIGTYSWDVFDAGTTGFSLEYNEGIGTDSYVAARDDSGTFANFPSYTDTAQLVILEVNRVNKRVSGTFRFTGVRFTDDTQTAVETIEFTNGTFYNIPYTTAAVVTPENAVLVRKIVNSYPGAGIADQTAVYTYEGNKIKKEVYTDSEGFVETTLYEYTGNLITKIESTDIDGLVFREIFTYDANKLVAYVAIDYWEETGVKETYEHNADGSITVSRFTGDLTSQLEADGTSTIQFTNGEVSSINFSTGAVKNYLYDNKKNPFKNVLGYDKIAFVDGESAGGISRNITQESAGGPVPTFTLTHTYNTTGNAIDYPATTSISSGVETDVVLTYTYQ